MKNPLITFINLIILITPFSVLHAQQQKEIGRAVTMDGRRIILYDNGTYRFELAELKGGSGTNVSTDTVQSLFPSPLTGTYESSPYNKSEWKSSRTGFTVNYNSKKWRLNLRNNNPPEEASLNMADTYCGLFSERLEIDYETWIQRQKLNYKEQDPQAKLVKEEWRTVNGTPMYFMVWILNIHRAKLKVYGLFAIGKKELMQMVISTPLDIAGETEEEINRLLSGFKVYKD